MSNLENNKIYAYNYYEPCGPNDLLHPEIVKASSEKEAYITIFIKYFDCLWDKLVNYIGENKPNDNILLKYFQEHYKANHIYYCELDEVWLEKYYPKDRQYYDEMIYQAVKEYAKICKNSDTFTKAGHSGNSIALCITEIII